MIDLNSTASAQIVVRPLKSDMKFASTETFREFYNKFLIQYQNFVRITAGDNQADLIERVLGSH